MSHEVAALAFSVLSTHGQCMRAAAGPSPIEIKLHVELDTRLTLMTSLCTTMLSFHRMLALVMR